ncbi:DUF4232 domain-containing protein [Rathayibacter festucae]|uniref:DUF4232 domain-containing protein n=1 Tax=Rathayibacter festucae TaxID=110937 RepID=UPI002A6B7D8F|nr:DUF4232 domain-containing protein [Rathayibacter festucae]MDY0912310.1 DUF4232 domain-containing protein [Rathayibacter festucae]
MLKTWTSRAALIALLTLPVLAVAGCAGSPVEAPAQTPSASTAVAAPTSSVSAAPQAAETGPVWPEDRCRDEQLAAEFVDRPDLSGAGQEGFAVLLTNVSEQACSYYGWPGMLLLDADGALLTSSGDSPLTMEAEPGAIAPGEAVEVEAQLTVVGAYDCTPMTATTVRVLVTSDGAGAGIDAPADLQVCDDSQSVLRTGPSTSAP